MQIIIESQALTWVTTLKQMKSDDEAFNSGTIALTTPDVSAQH